MKVFKLTCFVCDQTIETEDIIEEFIGHIKLLGWWELRNRWLCPKCKLKGLIQELRYE